MPNSPSSTRLAPWLRTRVVVGLVGFEPTTPALSRRCSNRLSYRPHALSRREHAQPRICHCCVVTADKCGRQKSNRSLSTSITSSSSNPASKIQLIQSASVFSRKEVIQPHLPIRLPCYDFTPVTNPAVVIALLTVRLTTSGRTRSHGVTGGVYKTRERIHRGNLIRDY